MKITIYELFGLVKDGKAPNKIKSEGHYYNYNKIEKDYYEGMGYDYEYLFKNTSNDRLNDEVEILEEEKKIPEKIKIEQDTSTSNYYIRNENGTKCGLTKHSKMIAETLNQVIDYLKSKGE